MTTEAAQKKRNHGAIARWAGAAFLLLAVIALAIGPGMGQGELNAWPALAIGLALVAVGYLQKIAAK